eukprot:scaffold10478_cov38-Cyclotella_meneghiniana.AAC.7
MFVLFNACCAKSFIAKAQVVRKCYEDRKDHVLHTGGQRNLFTVHVLSVKESGVNSDTLEGYIPEIDRPDMGPLMCIITSGPITSAHLDGQKGATE